MTLLSDDESIVAAVPPPDNVLALHRALTPKPRMRTINTIRTVDKPDLPKARRLAATHAMAAAVEPRTGCLPLHYAAAFLCGGEAQRIVRRLVCTYPAAAAAPDARGRLPLHLTFHEQGNIGPKGLEALLKAHPAAAMVRDHSGRTPLHYACMSTSLKGSLCPRFETLPMPRTGICRKSDESDPVVILAAAAPRAAVVRDKNGHTPLHLALRRSAHLYVPELLEVAPEAAAVRDPRGRLPLLAACADGDGMVTGELAALVAALPAAAIERDWLGRTPLLLVSRQRIRACWRRRTGCADSRFPGSGSRKELDRPYRAARSSEERSWFACCGCGAAQSASCSRGPRRALLPHMRLYSGKMDGVVRLSLDRVCVYDYFALA